MIDRRDFIKRTALASSSMMAFQSMSGFATTNTENKIPYSVLGRTGVQVSKLAIGCGPFKGAITAQNVRDILNRAIEEKINFLDTAPNYGGGSSEKLLGEAMKGIRDNFFLVSKTEAHTYKGTWELLEQSLDRMQTDYIDLIHLHNFGHTTRFPDLKETFSNKGAMGALREAKKKGKIHFIGASGHINPSRFHYAIDSGEIDALMLAVNYIVQHSYNFEAKIWSRAVDQNLGVIAMKVLGGKGWKNSPGKFKIPAEDYKMAMRYAITLRGLSTAVIGIETLDELNQAIDTFKSIQPFSQEEYLEAAHRGLELMMKDQRWRTVYGKQTI